MINSEKLKQMIKNNGYTYTDVGRLIGASYFSFNNRMNNKINFSANEIYIICKRLNIKDLKTIEDIFFYDMQKVS